MFIWLSIVLCCPVQTSQWLLFPRDQGSILKKLFLGNSAKHFMASLSDFAFSSSLSTLTASYLWAWVCLELVQPCSFLTPSSSPDLSHFLRSACPFWDPTWETLLPTFIPGTAGTELSSDSGCPFKSFYFVPNVSVPNQLTQECTEKVMAKQSAYYTHLISKAFGCFLVSVGQLTASVCCSLIVQLIKAIVWAGVNIPPGLCLHLPPMSLLSQHRFDHLVGKNQYYFNIATNWFKEKW